MKIAVKTKINEWGAAGDREKIVFDLLDLSPDQVGDIDRAIRHNSEDPVRMTIEPVQKKLQIPPIISQVRLVSMNCMTGGQKLKIADFKSPDERATAMKRLTASDTQIKLILEDVQGKLFDDQKDQKQIDFDKADYTVNKNNVVENPSVLEVKLPKSYGTKISIKWARIEGKFFIGLDIENRKSGTGFPISTEDVSNPPFDSLSDALITAQDKICAFIKENKFKHDKQIRTKVIKAVENYLEGQK